MQMTSWHEMLISEQPSMTSLPRWHITMQLPCERFDYLQLLINFWTYSWTKWFQNREIEGVAPPARIIVLETTFLVATEKPFRSWSDLLMPRPCLVLFSWQQMEGMHTFPGGPMAGGWHPPSRPCDLELEKFFPRLCKPHQTLEEEETIRLELWLRQLSSPTTTTCLPLWEAYSVPKPTQDLVLTNRKNIMHFPCQLIYATTEELSDIRAMS